MISFDQDTDSYRPKNRIKPVHQVDIVKSLENVTIDDIMEKIQTICKQKNVRISEFMRDFDRLRSGSITETQFLSCLSMSKLFFTREESKLLIEKYRNPEKPKEVLWRKFCDEVDEVFVVKELEKRNDIDQLNHITKSSFSLSELSLADQATLQDILKDMKKFFEVNRIDPKPAFANYDHLKRGKVLSSQFQKICHSMKYYIDDAKIEILMKKYGDAISYEINYILILNDSNEIGGNFVLGDEEKSGNGKNITPVLSSANNFYTYQTHSRVYDSDVMEVIDKIKNVVKINRIRLQEFFNDFDTLRKGVVTKAKFRTAMNMANLSLSSGDFDLLEKAFEIRNDNLRVNYKELIEDVETVFTVKGLEKNPLERPKIYVIPDFLDPNKRMVGDEDDALHKVMIKLAVLMNKYRVIPKSYFKDADRAKIGVIPSSKFSSYLSFLKLEVDEREMKLLIKRFHSKTEIEINYFDFDLILNKYCQLVSNN